MMMKEEDMAKELPQVLKRLNAYLKKCGWAIIEPYDDIRVADPSANRCVLCETTEGCKIIIPHLTHIESGGWGATGDGAVCANLAQCHKRRKDREEQRKSASEGRLKEIAAKLVFPKGEAEDAG